jgi:Zn-dependent M16 (insulinase) family peptidase
MTHLWEKIRVQGGAYGAFAQFDDATGVFTFLSYRDPNIAATIENYDKAAAFLKGLDASRLSDNELKKSIIAAIGELDAYQLPDAKGYTSMMRYITGRTMTRCARNPRRSAFDQRRRFHRTLVKCWKKPPSPMRWWCWVTVRAGGCGGRVEDNEGGVKTLSLSGRGDKEFI